MDEGRGVVVQGRENEHWHGAVQEGGRGKERDTVQESSSERVTFKSPPYPYERMRKRWDALDRLDLRFQWGDYGIRVLRCHLTHFPAGSTVGSHAHNEFEFHFIPRGKGRLTLEEGVYELQEGLFYLTGPGVVHQQWSHLEEPMDELCLHCEIVRLERAASVEEADWGAAIEAHEAEEVIRVLRQAQALPLPDRYHAMGCFLQAYRVWEEQTVGFYTSIRQEILQILIRAARAIAPDRDAALIPQRNMKSYRYQLARQYIEVNAARPLTLEDAATAVGISGRQLQRLFRSEGHTTFRAELEAARLAHIAEELVVSDSSVEEIAWRNGYVNPTYLYPVFKERFGMTPTAYRRLYGGAKETGNEPGNGQGNEPGNEPGDGLEQ